MHRGHRGAAAAGQQPPRAVGEAAHARPLNGRQAERERHARLDAVHEQPERQGRGDEELERLASPERWAEPEQHRREQQHEQRLVGRRRMAGDAIAEIHAPWERRCRAVGTIRKAAHVEADPPDAHADARGTANRSPVASRTPRNRLTISLTAIQPPSSAPTTVFPAISTDGWRKFSSVAAGSSSQRARLPMTAPTAAAVMIDHRGAQTTRRSSSNKAGIQTAWSDYGDDVDRTPDRGVRSKVVKRSAPPFFDAGCDVRMGLHANGVRLRAVLM